MLRFLILLHVFELIILSVLFHVSEITILSVLLHVSELTILSMLFNVSELTILSYYFMYLCEVYFHCLSHVSVTSTSPGMFHVSCLCTILQTHGTRSFVSCLYKFTLCVFVIFQLFFFSTLQTCYVFGCIPLCALLCFSFSFRLYVFHFSFPFTHTVYFFLFHCVFVCVSSFSSACPRSHWHPHALSTCRAAGRKLALHVPTIRSFPGILFSRLRHTGSVWDWSYVGYNCG